MSPRIAVLGLHLEANAFAPPTLLEDFAAQCLVRGQEIDAQARAPSSALPAELPGFYGRMDATGPWTPCPILVANAPPGGPIAQEVFLDFLDEMRRGLLAAMPLDGVYVANHGASSATGDEDSDGTMLAMVRAVVGSLNQAGLMPNSVLSIMLISPKLWLNSPLKIRIEINDGTAYGRISRTR